jgi:sugar O-acyltransferase (sialic acid O-acetyltransferase NeuD family)
MRQLVIIGAGGLGRELLDIIEAINEQSPTYEVLGFLDDARGHEDLVTQRNMRVLGPVDTLASMKVDYIIGIGAAATRRRIDALATELGRQPASAIHPAASMGSNNTIGPGAIIAAGARLTTNITLARHVQVHANATIGHDTHLHDYVTVLPGANVGGAVTLCSDVTIGSGAIVIQGLAIGRLTTVGAGGVVVRDLPEGVTAVGSPARPL